MGSSLRSLETKGEIITQVKDSIWIDSRSTERHVAIMSGDRFQQLLFRFQVRVPSYAWESFKKPDFQLEIAPDFLTDVKTPKDMRSRVLALAAMY